MPPGPPCPGPHDVHLWRVEIDTLARSPDTVARGLDSLDAAERDRYERYRADDDRLMFLAGRLMARAVVGNALGIASGAWQWRENARGRPEVASPDCAIRFNLAHSARMVVCAVANGREVGVDVEDRQRAAFDPRLVHRYCAPAEAADIEAQGEGWRDRFLIYWTLKEAYLKALGLGISVPLAEIGFTLEPDVRIGFLGTLSGSSTNWSFHLRRPTERHLVAVAVEGDSAQVHEREWQLA
jgi:4'-phosphopantetheinyl transferase